MCAMPTRETECAVVLVFSRVQEIITFCISVFEPEQKCIETEDLVVIFLSLGFYFGKCGLNKKIEGRNRFEIMQKTIGQYRLGGTLGQGEFGKVKLATHVVTKRQVAIKLIRKAKLAQGASERLAREIEILKKVRENSVAFVVAFTEVVETDDLVGVVLGYASGKLLIRVHCLVHSNLHGSLP